MDRPQGHMQHRHKFSFWATVTSNGSPYATGPLSCLSCLSVTLVYCGQTAGWIRIPLGMEVGLGSGDIVLAGDPAPLPKGALFGPLCSGTVAHLNNCWAVAIINWTVTFQKPVFQPCENSISSPRKRTLSIVYGTYPWLCNEKSQIWLHPTIVPLPVALPYTGRFSESIHRQTQQ